MRVVDSRRLRGPNLQTPGPTALAEVTLERGERAPRAIEAWRDVTARMGRALGWRKQTAGAVARAFPGGIAFALPAPIDVLLVATEVNDWAIDQASRMLAGERLRDFDLALERFTADIARSARPGLVLLERAARRRGAPLLWDDDQVTLGMAKTSRSYPIDGLPAPDDVPWSSIDRIPVALVTGTNGKTTTSRLLARMAKEAGLIAGSTSTDGIAVDERLVEDGDWTGAEAARTVLRRQDVELAVLETARGGILRRGLGVDACDAAIVTNVTRDHLGEFGVFDLATMARTKCVVASVVRRGGRAVLNADDPRLMRLLPEIKAKVTLFSRRLGPAARAHVRGGGVVFGVDGGEMVRLSRKASRPLAGIDEVPLAFRGAATHNVENALAAAAAAEALGLPREAIVRALRTFGESSADNPGRGHALTLPSGVRVLLDFGHNPAGVRTLLRLARSMAARQGRVVMAVTQPGDRSDEDFRALSTEIANARPRLAISWESEAYRRGRERGEISKKLRDALREAGMAKRDVTTADGEVAAIQMAVGRARPGDVVILAPEIDRKGVWAALVGLGARAPSA